MRIVIDTNVVVSALRRNAKTPAAVVTAMRARVFVPLYDKRIEDEYCDVLARPKLLASLVGTAAFLHDLVAMGELVHASPVAFTLPDAKDQCFLEVALAGAADAIITGNGKDFPLNCGVRILSPAAAVALFELGR